MRNRPTVEVRDYWDIFLRRRWWIILPALIIGSGTMAVVSKLPKIYLSQTTILVEPQKVPSDFVKPTVTTGVSNRLQIISQEILSRTHLQRIIDKFGLYRNEPAAGWDLNVLLTKGKRTHEETIDDMRKDIAIETVTDEQGPNHSLGAFKISYQGHDPSLVQQVAQELATLFIEENERVRKQQAEGTTRFIDDELDKARLSLEEQERRRKDFKVAYMGSLPEQQVANLQLLGQLQVELQVNGDALAHAQSQKIYEQSLLTAITSRGADPLTPPPNSGNPELDARRKELAQAQAKYTPHHPDLIALEAEVKKLEMQAPPPSEPATNASSAAPSEDLAPAQIRGQIAILDAEIKRRTQQEAQIEKRIQQMEVRVEALPAVEQQMSEMDRDYETSKMEYRSLLEKKNASVMAAEMERQAEGEQFRVIDPANYPEKPYKPDVAQLSLLGVLGGILCGCALGLFVEFRDRSIRSPHDVTFYLATPALATLPLLSHANVKKTKARLLSGGMTSLNLQGVAEGTVPTVLAETPTAAEGFAPIVPKERRPSILGRLAAARNEPDDHYGTYAREQFRIIRTRLVELMRARPIRSIMVTGASGGEGKTWVSTNLAFAMSQLQSLRVLLVDADLRRAGVSKLLGVNPRVGLSDYLANGTGLDEVRMRLGTNFSVVATGPVQESSAELLSGKRMGNFLEKALSEYDLVILDTPPVLALADAQVLAALVDAAIMVVRAGSSDYNLVRDAIELLKPKTIGVVVNGVAAGAVKFYHYYYGSPERSR